jgi:hypothetical protein
MTRRRQLCCPWLVGCLALLQCSCLAAMAQISPNCQRNGRHAFCAVTPRTDPGQADTVVEVITFADHTMVEARREQGSCKPVGDRVITCNATLIVSPGSGQAIRATYRGTAYEGGYTNAYDARGFSLQYSVID